MKSKLLAIVIVFTCLFVFPFHISAQGELPDAGTGGFELPDAAGSGSEEPEAPSEEDAAAAIEKSNQDFINGVLVGVGFGVVIGGIVIWFVKRGN